MDSPGLGSHTACAWHQAQRHRACSRSRHWLREEAAVWVWALPSALSSPPRPGQEAFSTALRVPRGREGGPSPAQLWAEEGFPGCTRHAASPSSGELGSQPLARGQGAHTSVVLHGRSGSQGSGVRVDGTVASQGTPTTPSWHVPLLQCRTLRIGRRSDVALSLSQWVAGLCLGLSQRQEQGLWHNHGSL